MTPEGKIKNEIMKYLKQIPDGYFFRVAQGKFSQSGISDILGVYRSKFVAIEAKVKGNSTTPLQQQFLRKVALAQGIAIVAYSVKDVSELIK